MGYPVADNHAEHERAHIGLAAASPAIKGLMICVMKRHATEGHSCLVNSRPQRTCGHESFCLTGERKAPFQAKRCTGERCKGQEEGSALGSQGWVGPSHSQNVIQVLLAHLIFLFDCHSNHTAASENVILSQPDTNFF